jgi:branched-subunit amino acid transport protein
MNISSQTKAMLKSWLNVFVAAVITALIVVLGDGGISVEDLWYVLVAGLVAVLPVVKNYFDPNDPRYGKGAASE